MTRACLCLLVAVLLSGCGVITDAHPPNDCVIIAARAQAELPPRAWSRLLVVSYADRPMMGHCFLVYETPGGHLWAYDAVRGSRLIYPPTRTARDVARCADWQAADGRYVEDLATR